MKNKKSIILILLLVFVCFIFIEIIRSVKNGQKYSHFEELPSKFELTSEDSNLFSLSILKKLRADQIYLDKLRGPVSCLIFDSSYYLVTYKVDLIAAIPFDSLFVIQHRHTDETTGVTYRVMGNPSFYFTWKGGPIKPTSKIYFVLRGDSLISKTYGDSITSYHLFCDRFSLRYAADAPTDLIFKGRAEDGDDMHSEPKSLDILFLKRNKELYLLFMTSKNPKSSVPADLLYNIIKENKSY